MRQDKTKVSCYDCHYRYTLTSLFTYTLTYGSAPRGSLFCKVFVIICNHYLTWTHFYHWCLSISKHTFKFMRWCILAIRPEWLTRWSTESRLHRPTLTGVRMTPRATFLWSLCLCLSLFPLLSCVEFIIDDKQRMIQSSIQQWTSKDISLVDPSIEQPCTSIFYLHSLHQIDLHDNLQSLGSFKWNLLLSSCVFFSYSCHSILFFVLFFDVRLTTGEKCDYWFLRCVDAAVYHADKI